MAKQPQTLNQLLREFERVLGKPKPSKKEG
jgi:hypothetical protein